MVMRRFFECPGGFAAIGDDLLVEMWRAPANLEQLSELNRAFRVEITRRSRRPFGTLAVMAMSPSTVLTVSEAERKLIVERSLEISELSFGAVTVVAMSGFSGAIVRGVLGTLTQLRKQRSPTRIVATVDEAVAALLEFFAKHGPGPISESMLRKAIDEGKPADWK